PQCKSFSLKGLAVDDSRARPELPTLRLDKNRSVRPPRPFCLDARAAGADVLCGSILCDHRLRPTREQYLKALGIPLFPPVIHTAAHFCGWGHDDLHVKLGGWRVGEPLGN